MTRPEFPAIARYDGPDPFAGSPLRPRPRILDLFCCDGTGADGYWDAGFKPVGVDNKRRKHYPYAFFRADAFEWMHENWKEVWQTFNAIHASPPCQLFTRAGHLREAQGHKSKEQLDLLTPTLEMLRGAPIPWVVENVEAAKSLMQPQPGESLVRVCGSFFGLDVQRHRLFLSNRPIEGTSCHHDQFPLDPITRKPRPWGVYHVPKDNIPHGGRTAESPEHARVLFGLKRPLPWNSIKEGFPPAYTKWIGKQLLAYIEGRVAA